MNNFKIGNCVIVTKGKFKGTKGDITHVESGSYLMGNANNTFRVYDGWIKKRKCPKIRGIK